MKQWGIFACGMILGAAGVFVVVSNYHHPDRYKILFGKVKTDFGILDSGKPLSSNEEIPVCLKFDAKTGNTWIYVDSTVVLSSGTTLCYKGFRSIKDNPEQMKIAAANAPSPPQETDRFADLIDNNSPPVAKKGMFDDLIPDSNKTGSPDTNR